MSMPLKHVSSGETASGAASVSDERVLSALTFAAQWFKQQLRRSTRAIEYLRARGISGDTAHRWHIGYAPPNWNGLLSAYDDKPALLAAGLITESDSRRQYDRFRDRIMFPILDEKCFAVGFGGRLLANSSEGTNAPKYLNSPETSVFRKSELIFGAHQFAQLSMIDEIIVVEGYVDVIAVEQAAIPGVVATMGTAATPQHFEALAQHGSAVNFCFDGDQPGRTAAFRTAAKIIAGDPDLLNRLQVRFTTLPSEHDPDSLIKELGRTAFLGQLQAGQYLDEFIVQELVSKHGNSSGNANMLAQEAAELMATATHQRTHNRMRHLLADHIGELAYSEHFDFGPDHYEHERRTFWRF